MNIAQLCKRPVVSIDSAAPLKEAATLMRKEHVGALLVTVADGDQPRAVGVVTDRDLAVEILARDLVPGDVRVGQLASRKLAAVPGSAGIVEAVAAMGEAGVRRLIVTADDGEITGFVSSDDILEAVAGELAGLSMALRNGIARESQERKSIPDPRPRPVFLPHGTPGMH